MKTNKIAQIFFVVLLIIKFKPRMCQEVFDLQNYGKINKSSEDSQIALETSTSLNPIMHQKEEISVVNSTASAEKVLTETNFNFSQIVIPILKEGIVYNKSIEYLIEEPNNSNSSYHQEVIIKPLNEISVTTKDKFNATKNEIEQNFVQNFTDLDHRSNNESKVENLADQLINLQIENSVQNLDTQPETVKNTLAEYSQKQNEELIINFLSPPQNKGTSSILKELNISSNKSDPLNTRTVLIKESNQLLKDRNLNESTTTSIKIRINPLNKILTKFLTKESTILSNKHQDELSLISTTTENISTESLKTEPIETNHKKEEEFIIKPLNMQNEYTVTTKNVEVINCTNDQQMTTTPTDIENYSTESQKNELLAITIAEEVEKPQYIQNTTVTLLQTLISSPSWTSKSEEEELWTRKPLTTLEDYAVKQMNFILDHMLLESQEFVAKVLQATGNTLFQRDHLKRYAENINHLLNPKLVTDYSDDMSDSSDTINNEQDLYEEVVKKLNFFKSKATKQLQNHLPNDWVKDYKNTKEELKIWLDKASYEMHREFNLYINEEEDHIKYLYFNEAFDDITRATEIHQKLALLADLIKIVKNKKQITFMDLYMQ